MKIFVTLHPLHQKYFLATKFRDGHATSFSSVTCATLIRFFCCDGDFLWLREMIIEPCPWNRFHVKFRLFVSCVFSLIIFVRWGRGGLARLDLSWSIDFCVLALPQAPMTATAPLSFSSGFMLSMFSDWQRLEENSSCNSVSSLPRWQRASSLLHIKTSRTTTTRSKMNALVHICV